jgi:phosphopantetheinyl transferase
MLAAQAPMEVLAREQQPGWLSESEQQRLAGLGPDRQSLFTACRYALRLLLAQPDGLPVDWCLGSESERAPWVESFCEAATGPLPQLSLSHSRGWLACAKAPVPVGVDLELKPHARQRDMSALAALVCAPSEQAWLESQPATLQTPCFLQLWCLKEAYFKCLGTGLDWALIRQRAWRRVEDEEAADAEGATPIAHAWLWQACTKDDEQLVLALCACQPLPPQACLLAMPEGLEWQAVTGWRLYVESTEG